MNPGSFPAAGSGRTRGLRRWSALLVVSCALVSVLLPASEYNPVRIAPAGNAPPPESTTPGVRLMVQWRSETGSAAAQLAPVSRGKSAIERAAGFAARNKLSLETSRPITPRWHAVQVQAASGESLGALLQRLGADPDVAAVEPDYWRYPHATPNDPLFAGQWYLQKGAATASAVNAVDAWDITQGNGGVVIAVLDTGVRYDHPDLLRASEGGRLLPGFDFVSDVPIANDGDGYDGDASDPGDWVAAGEGSTLRISGCSSSDSSWHGTRVSGMIGALTQNGAGIGGGTWRGFVLPIRGLGKCGGFDSDIVAGMLWAGGIPVSSAPANPYPARIINMSLGSAGACTALYRDAVAQLAARGVLVVASAGNEGGPVGTPASCPGVAGIAGIRHVGTKVGFSNIGPEIALSAPGGNCVNVGAGQPCLFSLDTTSDSGKTAPAGSIVTNQLQFNVGTSFSAPIVSAIAGLMLSVNGQLNAAQLLARLREGATSPFPVSTDAAIPLCRVPAGRNDLQSTECNCTTATCGAGMANALGSVNAALRPVATVTLPASVAAGQDLTLRAVGGAACGRAVSGYSWTLVSTSGGASAPGLGAANTPQLTVTAPAGAGAYVLRLTVTDDAAGTDSADITVTAAAATSPAASTSGASVALPACIAALSNAPAILGVSPAAAVVPVGTTRSFSSSFSAATVTWQVNGIAGGSATTGTITASGVFTAPAVVPAPAEVRVSAVSLADSARVASADVTITSGPPVSVTVSPASASVPVGSTQPFSAAVANTSNGSVVWRVNDIVGGNSTLGSVSATGVYTAPAGVPTPATVTISAVAAADAAQSGSAVITVLAAPVASAAVSGGSGGGGGGALDAVTLLALLLGLMALRRTRRA